jgi:hypothetical protein
LSPAAAAKAPAVTDVLLEPNFDEEVFESFKGK